MGSNKHNGLDEIIHGSRIGKACAEAEVVYKPYKQGNPKIVFAEPRVC